MAKIRTTEREVRRAYENVIVVGYCRLQNLLQFFTPQCYTVREEGCASDIYDFGTTAISTGYAPFGNIHVDHDILQHYDEIGDKLAKDPVLTWQAQKKKARELINIMIEKAIKKEEK